MKTSIKKPKLGLALGGGGARGFAHIGILKVLEKEGIEIDYIAGTSMGALVGGIYAATKDIKKIETIACGSGARRFVSLMFEPTLKGALVGGTKVLDFIEEIIGKKKFEDLEIPFCAVATNTKTGDPTYLEKGSIAEAIRASISYPMVFAPSRIGKDIYIDGGLSCQVPADKVRAMGADIVIAVNLDGEYKFDPTIEWNIAKMGEHSLKLLTHSLARFNSQNADICMKPKVWGFNTWMDFPKAKAIIKAGEREGKKLIPHIKESISKTSTKRGRLKNN